MSADAVIEAARRAMLLASHTPECDSSGCTCGATNQFAEARAEFYRRLRAWEQRLVTTRADLPTVEWDP